MLAVTLCATVKLGLSPYGKKIDIVIRDSYVREYGNYSLKEFDAV